MDCLRRGDAATHNRLIAARAPELDRMDAVMLAHFSTSIAAAEVRKMVGMTVLSAPDSAVRQMRLLIEGAACASVVRRAVRKLRAWVMADVRVRPA